MKMQFSIRTMIVVVTAIGLVTNSALLISRFVGKDDLPTRPFVSSLWRQAAPTNPSRRTLRSEMVDDLLTTYNFTGWSRNQVTALLGPPSSASAGFEQWDIYYVLGLERASAYSLDEEALGFKFDNTGKVVKYGVSVN